MNDEMIQDSKYQRDSLPSTYTQWMNKKEDSRQVTTLWLYYIGKVMTTRITNAKTFIRILQKCPHSFRFLLVKNRKNGPRHFLSSINVAVPLLGLPSFNFLLCKVEPPLHLLLFSTTSIVIRLLVNTTTRVIIYGVGAPIFATVSLCMCNSSSVK